MGWHNNIVSNSITDELTRTEAVLQYTEHLRESKCYRQQRHIVGPQRSNRKNIFNYSLIPSYDKKLIAL